MRRLMLAAGVAAILSASSAHAWGTHYVRPYVNGNGTYVQGHYRTNPDGNRLNNWSTQGNVNPYTGSAGTGEPLRAAAALVPIRRLRWIRAIRAAAAHSRARGPVPLAEETDRP
jgi:hypothetical protein